MERPLLNRSKNATTIIFDFDGTLIDSAPAILEAFSAALQTHGITPHVALTHTLIGPPLAETLRRISGSDDAALIGALSDSFKRHYDTTGVAATRPYPGIETMLDALAAAGIPLHIATNKRLSVTRAILENLGWQERFVSVYALDMSAPPLPGKAHLLTRQLAEQALAPARTRYIGDKREDGLAADANALAFGYAAWGYGELDRARFDDGWHWLDQPAAIHSFHHQEDATWHSTPD